MLLFKQSLELPENTTKYFRTRERLEKSEKLHLANFMVFNSQFGFVPIDYEWFKKWLSEQPYELSLELYVSCGTNIDFYFPKSESNLKFTVYIP